MTWIRREIIEPDTFIICINSCSIFQNEQNQLFFLSKLSHYLNEMKFTPIVPQQNSF
jgi:hypothetical protein